MPAITVKRSGPFNQKMLLRLTEGHIEDIEKVAKKLKISKAGFVRQAVERQVSVQLSRGKR